MITAKDAHDTVQSNIDTEVNAVLNEINDEIERLINVVNVPKFELQHPMVAHAYPQVEKSLIALGYTVTKTDHKAGKVMIKVGWHTVAP